MAFNQEKFDIIKQYRDGTSICCYRDSGTVLATLVASGYMDTAQAVLGTGSIVMVVGSDAVSTYSAVNTAGVITLTHQISATNATTASAAELNYNDITTLGTGAASKAVVLDAGEDYTWPATGILTYGVLKDPAGTVKLATVLEVNRTCDVSTRLVAAGATLAATVALHDGKIILLDTAAGSIVTLPVAAATGAKLTVAVSVTATSNSHIVKVGNASDFISGFITVIDLDGTAAGMYKGDGAADDTITMNRTTTGGIIGDILEFYDILPNIWLVKGNLTCAVGSNIADPFSATV